MMTGGGNSVGTSGGGRRPRKMPDPSNKGERVVPMMWQYDPRDLACHLARYTFALQFCQHKVVLDAACGVGYGTQILSYVADDVVGIDKSRDAIEYAQDHYDGPRTEFVLGDVRDLIWVGEGVFDVIVSFETVEHLEDPKPFIEEVASVLDDEGMFIVSAPENSGSIHHVKDYTKQELHDLLASEFDMGIADYYCQGPTLEIEFDGFPIWGHPTHIFVCYKGGR
jgi:2-polyprenyl-3-methyl-5-hydroxy-6-metoxy-1,4-benzoquinol methylase